MIEDVLVLITVVPAAGTLPPSWGSHGCFADLADLGIWNMNVSGPLPPGWGGPATFKHLETLVLNNCTITGKTVIEFALIVRMVLNHI